MIMQQYGELMNLYEKVTLLRTVQGQLEWDFETKMPSKGVELRSRQLALVSGLLHGAITDPRIGELIASLKQDPGYGKLSEAQQRNLHLFEREYRRESSIPQELVEAISKQSAVAISTWKKAKAARDFSLFKPELQKMFELVKKRASYIDPDKDPYDVLLDRYEPSFTAEMYSKLFSELRDGLLPLLAKCTASSRKPDTSLTGRTCPESIQVNLSETIPEIIGYDTEKRGRIDTTEHPFTSGYYDDVRITTHYYEDNFTRSFFSVLHEGGHALVDQNLPREFMYQPLGDTNLVSYGIHESQSRFIENLIGRSREFWEYYYPRFQAITGDTWKDVDFDDFFLATNRVEPSKIRIYADELTYSLHIIIRFEVERDLFAGKITVDDLPTEWNKKYKDYLGITIENDSEGVMQDTHWASGYFGYFPTYALGNIYNGQMLAAMKKKLPGYKELIKKGNLKPIIDWLVKNVHEQSNMYSPTVLLKKITGGEVSPRHFLDYLASKYSEIYRFALD